MICAMNTPPTYCGAWWIHWYHLQICHLFVTTAILFRCFVDSQHYMIGTDMCHLWLANWQYFMSHLAVLSKHCLHLGPIYIFLNWSRIKKLDWFWYNTARSRRMWSMFNVWPKMAAYNWVSSGQDIDLGVLGISKILTLVSLVYPRETE